MSAIERAIETLRPHDLERRIIGNVQRSVARAIIAAVAEEREACAKEADLYQHDEGSDGASIARAIRERGK